LDIDGGKIKLKGIRQRLVGSYLLIVFVAVLIIDLLLISGIKHYYYSNVEEILYNEIKTSSNLYTNYFSSQSLSDNIQNNSDLFWKNTLAQVQIMDPSGNVLLDSLGVLHKKPISTSDFKKAIKGNVGYWRGYVDYDANPMLSVSYPLKTGENTVGVIRFVSSLKQVNENLFNISTVLILLGLLVIVVIGVISIFLSNSIIEPIIQITRFAEQMAKGRFNKKIPKKYDDEVGKLTDTLNYMAEEILNSDKLKNEFISSISHELRTPLTAIKGWAITINSGNIGEVSSNVREAVSIIEKESERLTLLVEDLLDFSKLSSGKISLKLNGVDLKDCVSKVITQMMPRAERSKIILDFEKEQDIPILSLDENRIKQVLINIIDNAFNFTPEGGKVKIKLTLNEDFVNIIISDTGTGISKEDLPKVKEKFYKGKGSNSNSGIGLSICDEIVNLHYGVLNIESEENSGTRVTIMLPVTIL